MVAVFTHADVPCNEFGINVNDQQVLAQDKVRSMSDPVAVVWAETEQAALAARSLVKVTYEDLPGVFDPRQAMQPGAPLVHEERERNIYRHIKVRKGDVAAGFAQAEVIVDGYYTTPFEEHAYLQPEAGLAYLDDTGRIVINVSTQWPQDDLHQIAHALQLPQEQIKEVVGPIGGAFGGREDISIQISSWPWAPICSSGRCRIVYSREDSVRGHGKRHPFYMTYRTGATRDGVLLAQEIELISDCGAYASTSGPVLANAISFAPGPYNVPHVKMDGYTVYTNNPVTMAFRGFGANQPAIAYEMQMEKLADALNMDPVELRMKNVHGRTARSGPLGNVDRERRGPEGDAGEGGAGGGLAAGRPALDGAQAACCLCALQAAWHWRGLWLEERWLQLRLRRQGDVPGGAAVSDFRSLGDFGSLRRRDVGRDARPTIAAATVKIGVAECGQGTTTGLAQIAAETSWASHSSG